MEYLLPARNVIKRFHSSSQGLSFSEAKKRLAIHALNELPTDKGKSRLSVLLTQFANPLVLVLVAALLATIGLHEWADALVITLALTLNTVVGYFQEYKAQEALLALQKTLSPQSRVIRGGRILDIASREIVPGDILVLRPGDKVGADIRLLEANELRLNESSLTGETAPVLKNILPLKKECPLGDRKNMAYWGTSVVGGTGKGVVVATGTNTEIGKISTLLQETEEGPTPFQRRLRQFSQNLTIAVLLLCVGIFILGFASGHSWEEMFVTSVALAVAAIPEGLVVSLTVILALGMQRIYKKKALLRNLVAAETLGSTTVICTDKTGTLTEGKMRVASWETVDDDFTFKTAVLCNDLSNPTDLALWEGVGSTDHRDPQLIFDEHPRLAVLPFSSANKYMATLNEFSNPQGEGVCVYALVKGAPEKILRWSKLSVKDQEYWRGLAENWATSGQRVLALARKRLPLSSEGTSLEQLNAALDSGFEFLGLVGLADPLRANVANALNVCRRAGMRLIVVTGDYRSTAEAIMHQLGVEVASDEVIDGQEMQNINDVDLDLRIKKIKLFARVTPGDKLRIVEALQRQGEVVAMTGDGVNDAPALKKADIGVVVGEATEVAKETADMVLLDSNFETIVDAVEEGRNIFERMKKIVVYLLSSSFTEVLLVGGSILLKLPLPVTAAQILWVNLVEDSLPSLALAFDPSEKEVMLDPPRRREAPLLDTEMKIIIFIVGLLSDVVLFILYLFFNSYHADITHVRSLMFVALAIDSLFYVYACHSFRRNIWEGGSLGSTPLNLAVLGSFTLLLLSFYFPPLKSILSLTSLNHADLLLLLLIGVGELLAVEVVKWFFLSRHQPVLPAKSSA